MEVTKTNVTNPRVPISEIFTIFVVAAHRYCQKRGLTNITTRTFVAICESTAWRM